MGHKMHERSTDVRRKNSFVTLTYSQENLPVGNELVHRHFQLFMKKLRNHVERSQNSKQEPTKGRPSVHRGTQPKKPDINIRKSKKQNKIRYYMTGEYGDKEGRPHFHAILFNVAFSDKQYFKKSPSGEKIYTSATLDKLWAKGFASIGNVTIESAAYVARYVIKKQGNKQTHQVIDPQTGEITNRKPEYSRMSRGEAIGKPWIRKYLSDVYPDGMMVVNGIQTRPPRIYDQYYKKRAPLKHRAMLERRAQETLSRLDETANHRLDAKEKVKQAQLNQLKRKL